MADRNILRRIVQVIFDRASAKKTELALEASLATAGKKGGENFVREVRAAFDKRMADLKVQLAKGLIDPARFKTQATLAAKEFNTGIIAGMEKARAAGTLTDREYLKLGRTLKRTGDEGSTAAARIQSGFLKAGAALVGFFGARKALAAIADSVHEALRVEQSVVQLDAVLRPLGLTYRAVAKEAEAYFDRLQATTRFEDDDAREALINLITITGDYQKSLGLLQLTANIAEKRQTTMAEASTTAGLAAQGLSKRMLDLGLSGHETGDIVQKLSVRLGNLAEEAGGKTNSAKVAQLRNLLNEVKESFGAALIGGAAFSGSVVSLKTALIDLNKWVKANEGEIAAFAGDLTSLARAILVVSGGASDVFRVLAGQAKIPSQRRALKQEIQDIVDQNEAIAEARERAQATWTKIHGDGIIQRRKLTEMEQHTIHKLMEDDGAALEDLTKKDLAALHSIQSEAAAGHISLTMMESEAVDKILKDAANETRRDQKQRAKEALRRAEELAKQFKENKQGVEQEIADLRRLAAVQGEGAGAVEVLNRALQTEADIRKAVKDLGPAEAAQLGTLITLRDEERAKVEALGRTLSQSLDLSIEIADLRRLAVAYGQGADAVEALQTQLQFEADLRQALKGVTGEQADQIAALLELRRREREETEKTKKAADDKAFLTALERERDVARQLADAQREGPAAVRAFNRELFIQQKIMEAGTKATADMIAKIRELAGAQFDAANVTQSSWVSALKTVEATMVDSLSGIGQAWVERGDSKERRQEIVKALKDENLSVERRIELEKELGELNTPWLVKFAKAKVKENIAAALEMAAKALGMLVFGNVPGATEAAASAAGHTAAAAAWRIVAGGGAGGGGASSTGGVGSSSPDLSRTESMQKAGPEVHLYFNGPRAFSPAMEEFVFVNMQNARERFHNANIHVHRSP